MYVTVDLQLDITRLDQDTYHLEMQLRLPGDAAPLRSQRSRLALDFERLQALFRDPESYGRALSQALFGNPDNRDYLVSLAAWQPRAGLPLRLLLAARPGSLASSSACAGRPCATRRMAAGCWGRRASSWCAGCTARIGRRANPLHAPTGRRPGSDLLPAGPARSLSVDGRAVG